MKNVKRQKLTYVDYKYSRTVPGAIHQLLYYYDALILGSITIAYIIMTMHGIVFNMNIAGGDECSHARCIA